ncbi:MAG: GGDEF domain-containing protein [Clostridia bacterium]|nr:GGDEF domain-containing protein [Clostridia bacterium]
MKFISNLRNRGVSQRKLNYVTVGLAILFSVLLLVSVYLTMSGYNAMRKATDDYIDLEKAATGMRVGSDYLTEQVRAFVVTGDRKYCDNYFNEANVTKRRDNALETIEQHLSETSAAQSLRASKEASDRLMESEYHAMLLTIAADSDYKLDDFPELKSTGNMVPQDEMRLTPEEMMKKAREIVFDTEYLRQKEAIMAKLDECLDYIETDTRAKEVDAADHMRGRLALQQVYIFALILIVLVMVVLTAVLVTGPLLRAIPRIRDDQPLDVTGAYEYRFLAKTYNRIYGSNKEKTARLAYQATHDELTGAYNRAGYEQVCNVVCANDYAMIIIDIDHFKGFNDTHGHDVGDRVLVKVSETLKNHFRSDDYISRIGGDEFVVLMTNVTEEFTDLIKKKINSVNAELAKPEDPEIAASVSVGVAFGGDDVSIRTVFKRADNALYQVKREGGGDCRFAE